MNKEQKTTCWGCIENQPNQFAHMEIGGCLYIISPEEDTKEKDTKEKDTKEKDTKKTIKKS